MPTRPLLGLFALTLTAPLVAQTDLHEFTGAATGDSFGQAVSMAGDVNADGFADVIVGSPGMENGGMQVTGAITVYSGFDGAVLHQIFGDGVDDEFGASVSGVGDLDADGHDDFGGGTGLNQTNGYARVFSGFDGSVILNYPSGETPGASLGVRVAAAGDVNGDGYDDALFGAPGVGDGEVEVISGYDGASLLLVAPTVTGGGFGTAVAPAGDVDGDGLGDLIVGTKSVVPFFDGSVQVLAGTTGAVLFEYGAIAAMPPFLVGTGVGVSVAGVGDINEDGAADFAFGEPDNFGNSTGRAYVCSGVDGSLMFDVLGTGPFDALGASIAGAGDVNGDAVDDVIIGVPGTGLTTDPGRIVVHSGVDGSQLSMLSGTIDSERLGLSVSGGADVDGDGFFDVACGAPTFASRRPGGR